MKALIVYESSIPPTSSNTRSVAEAIARGLEFGVDVDVEVAEVSEAPPMPREVDLLVVGGSVEPAAHEAHLEAWLEQLTQKHGPAAAAAFDTTVHSRWFHAGAMARQEARALRRAGYEVLGRPEHFYVKSAQGPLVDGELERAKTWGMHLAELVTEPLGVPAPS